MAATGTLPPLAAPMPIADAGALRLDGPRFSEPGPIAKHLPPRSDKPWNIVWIVMESTGLRYVEGETYRGRLPMPYLKQLASRGWYLARHRSPSNSSATSIFAQLSGLYPRPTVEMFATRKDNHVPSLFTFLGPAYDSFLVTPGKLTYFFPKHFLVHSGLREMHGFDEVPVTKNPGGEGLSKDETEVVSFFLQRLARAKPPFAAVYYSYVAHWEYTDYGPRWRQFGGGRLIDRYHNNLVLLDAQIRRIVEQLERDGRLDSTILVLAGDHGEAFGQHERNWAHARGSYEENFGTPAVLVQPRLFPPKVVDWPTSHVDLLPTVLDALGLPYDPALLQGESLYQARLLRKYQFAWGNEGMITALGADGVKVQLSTTDKRCQAFDLARDPHERKRLGCERHAAQLAALRAYRQFQREALPAYSAAVAAGQAFRGHRHPGLAPVATGPGRPQAAPTP